MRVVTAVVFSVQIAVNSQPTVCAAALAAALALAAFARLPVGALLKRMALVNAFVVLVALLLPLSVPGEPAFQIGPLAFSQPGLQQAGLIALRANAIVLVVVSLLGTMEIATLGHALHHMKAPDKLVHLLLLCVRYVDVLRREYLRLVTAMKARGFRLRFARHTFRTLGHLVGMMLVRSFDRADRIMAAMKCRGFHGRFHVVSHFRLRRADLAFAAVALVVFIAFTWGQQA